jgi:hypothetical protein
LPADLFDKVLPHKPEWYRRRVVIEATYEPRRHPEPRGSPGSRPSSVFEVASSPITWSNSLSAMSASSLCETG